MKITYKIDKEQKLIIETWPEKLTIEDYYDVKKREFEDSDFRKEFNVITDLRKVNEGFNEEIIIGIIDFMKKNSDKMKNKKSAVIADSPQLVASALFFGHKYKNTTIKVSVFSSMNAAIKWINENWEKSY